MELRTDTLDLWVFARTNDGPCYLLLHTSQEKADRFFGGGRFWQIPGAFLEDGEDAVSALERVPTRLSSSRVLLSCLLRVAADLHRAPPARLILRPIKEQPAASSVMTGALFQRCDVIGGRQLER